MKLPKVYEPKQYEPSIYGLWESSGAFRPTGKGVPYTIVMPPPNANASLHIGHALGTAIQDILIRYHRMQGRDAAYIPGADHAGFETWVVYEKHLASKGKSRFDFTREQLYSGVWDFVEKNRGVMELQLRQLGGSATWENSFYTLDSNVISTVYDTFKKLWDDGLVYRGERIVNYCTVHQTSFADIEVVHKNEKAKLWRIAYPTMSRVGEIVVATSRPETMLGDTAVAVHPDDERYKHLIGTTVKLPLSTREIPIIADEAVDPAFGTGAVKVTPAHDPNDFAMGERHNLESIQVIGFDGLMTEQAGAFAGVEVLAAREKILTVLNSQELIRGEDEYEQTKGHCYKCGTVIQPLVKDQWFLKVKPLADRAVEALQQGSITVTPSSKKDLLMRYLNELHDWNLSRQIPWGIPIPAFQNIHDHTDWIFDTRIDQPAIEVDGKTYKREEDTFDTWFSSGQLPYIVTLHATNEALKRHYPTDVMETGHDILRPWVARMIMLGLYTTGDVPFRHVYMHGMVTDEKGQKMSKSKGNVINPMEVLEEFGSDAMRIGIVSNRSAGQNQPFSTAKVVAGRNFCNKLWNMARFIEGIVGDEHPKKAATPETAADHWAVRQLNRATEQVGELLAEYRFAEATEVVYHTLWDDVADWYLEASKQSPNVPLLAWVLETILRIAHPFAPFVTETIWQTIAWEKTPLIKAAWPNTADFDTKKADTFEQLQALVTEVRFVAADLGAGKQTLLYGHDVLIKSEADTIKRLARLEAVTHADKPRGLRLAVPGREAWLDVDDDTLYEHQNKLEARLAECRQIIDRLEGRLANEGYVKSAPTEVVQQSRDQLAEQRHLEERLVNELKVL